MSWEELPLDRIYYDAAIGVPGTVWPIGTPGVPSNTAADVVTMLAARYLRKISIYGLFTVPSAMEGYEFIGHGQYSALDTINFNGQDVDTSVFRYLNLTGAQGGTGLITMDDCHLVNPTNISGTFFRCLIQQATLRNGVTDMVECSGWQGAAAITVDAPNPLNMFGWSGAVTLGGMTGGIVNIFARGALITILATCTGGTVNIYGSARVTDNSGAGCTVNDYSKETELDHVPKYTRELHHVDGTHGNDANDGKSPDTAWATILHALATILPGDVVCIAQGTYDEAISIPAGLIGLEIICEPGVLLLNTTPGTVVSIAAPDVKWTGGLINQAGQIGLDVTGKRFTGIRILVDGCTTSFDINEDDARLVDCYSLEHTTTGFDISQANNWLRRCIAVGTAATTGFNLSHTNAHRNVLDRCHSLNNAANGFNLVVGADENLINRCSQSSLCGGPADAGANNTFVSFEEESQITAGNSLQDDLATFATSQGRMLFTMDFWSNPVEEKAITAAQVTAAVGAAVVVAGLPAGATIVRAIVMMKFRMVENTNAAENSLDCTAVQPIQVDDVANTGWLTAIDFVDEQFKIAAETREGGDVLIGDNNVAARVDGNDTYDFQWLNAKAHLANIQFNDIQMGIRIWYSV